VNISYCIITKGDRPEKLAALIESINTTPYTYDYEITVAVETGHKCLGLLRNQACRSAKYPILAVLDDDLILDSDFIKGIENFGDDWDVMCPKVLNPDGSRYWDWREVTENGQRMVDYHIVDAGNMVPPGCCILLKREVFECIQWDETIPYYTAPFEDIDFSRRLHAAGYICKMNPLSTVHHNDPRYYQVGDVVGKREI
jgi:hypothetical protein